MQSCRWENEFPHSSSGASWAKKLKYVKSQEVKKCWIDPGFIANNLY